MEFLNGSLSNMSSRTTGTFTKKRPEDSTMEECDSTTEPANHKMQFQLGEDVYYQEETGQNVLGTVALVQGKKIKIIFMDETEKWAPISKVKKLSISYNEEEDENSKHSSSLPVTSVVHPTNDGGSVTSASKKKLKGDVNGQIVPKENLPVTCGSCGTQKMITSKKAQEYSPYTHHQYNCRKCINKSKTNNNNGVPLPLAAHYMAAAARNRPKGSDNGAMSLSKILDQGLTNGIFRQENDICLHCRSQIIEKVGLQCSMCSRSCHPSCLALTPPPLPGDIFWSIICHMCGTQKLDGSPDNDSQKIYSSRRSITCWSDVAYLLLSCLMCKYSSERFFDLDSDIIPFWEANFPRLHLPRQYKNSDPDERRRMLESALSNSNLRYFKDDDKKENPSWAIKDGAIKWLNTFISKPQAANAGRGVTVGGFPIGVRSSNPEAASAAMTNIAQTIAASKANSSVPTPKNSPSNLPSKSNFVSKTIGAGPAGSVASGGRKPAKNSDHTPVAKKTGSELNSGAQRPKYNDIWPQSRYQKATFLPELPKAGPNIVAGTRGLEDVSSNGRIQNGTLVQPPSHQKHSVVLSASPGGAARVTGMIISSNAAPASTGSTGEATSKSSTGSYPVRKNGSPMINRSIRVEHVERKKEKDAQQHSVTPTTYRFEVDGARKLEQQDFIRESPGFNNTSQQKLPVKRKLSTPTKPTDNSSATLSRVLDGQGVSSDAKKLKMSLPTSTDVTSQRVPSPSKPPDFDSATKGPKKAMSPLQKLSDLQRNGGLTVACLTHTESGVQTVAINASALGEVNLSTTKESDSNSSNISTERFDTHMSTPVKNLNGASAAKVVEVIKPVILTLEGDENTKEKAINVTTSPRAFKIASVSSPGTSKGSPNSERRMGRPVRLKRTVVANAQTDKQSKDGNDMTAKKKVNVKGSKEAAAALVAKASRGRPKKPYKLLRKPNGMAYNIGQFNGPVKDVSTENSSGQTINESDYTWNNSTVSDLLQYGHGYRLGCLPRCPDKTEDIVKAAVNHFKEEVAPRPPSYWSSISNHSKKSTNQRSSRDLKNVDSYYVSGSRIDENGVQYQVVWRDGYGFEYSSDEEEESGVELGDDNYIHFDDYDHMEYFLDKIPVTVNSLNGHCDTNNETDSEDSAESKDGEQERVCFSSKGYNTNTGESPRVKREPTDSAESSPAKGHVDNNVPVNFPTSAEATASPSEPELESVMCIDLTDSP